MVTDGARWVAVLRKTHGVDGMVDGSWLVLVNSNGG